MRREIDDHETAGRAQYARSLAKRARAVVEIMQHLMHHNCIKGVAREREVVEIALPHRAVLQACLVEIGAGELQHLRIEVDADTAGNLRTEQFENAAGSGAEIEKRVDGFSRERLAHRGFHRNIGNMQLAQLVPAGRMLTEITLRRLLTAGAHLREPFAVALEDRIRRIGQRKDRIGKRRPGAFGSPAIECPGCFAKALDDAGLGKQPQMARDARLRLPENVGEIGDGQFRLVEQRQQAQARILRGRLQATEQGFETGRSFPSNHRQIPTGMGKSPSPTI